MLYLSFMVVCSMNQNFKSIEIQKQKNRILNRYKKNSDYKIKNYFMVLRKPTVNKRNFSFYYIRLK